MTKSSAQRRRLHVLIAVILNLSCLAQKDTSRLTTRHLTHTLTIINSEHKNHRNASHCSGHLPLLTLLIHTVRQPQNWLNQQGLKQDVEAERYA